LELTANVEKLIADVEKLTANVLFLFKKACLFYTIQK
jgi:hypothetical protein